MSLLAPARRVMASHELLWNLTLRELRTKYRRSFLGWTWSMLNPLATVAIYSYVFGTVSVVRTSAMELLHDGHESWHEQSHCQLIACAQGGVPT